MMSYCKDKTCTNEQGENSSDKGKLRVELRFPQTGKGAGHPQQKNSLNKATEMRLSREQGQLSGVEGTHVGVNGNKSDLQIFNK